MVALIATAVLAMMAYRASVGMSYYDDTFYAAVPWRFAHGARFLVDELSFQTQASMISVPLVWIWERLFGLTGLVLAIRLLWVPIAAAGAFAATRMLRGTTSLPVAALAVGLPLLAPPYHIFAPTYNTLSSLLLTLAVVFAFAAERDGNRTRAYLAGAALGLGVVSYPPMAIPAAALVVTYVAMTWRSGLWWRVVLVAAAVGAVLGGLLLWGVPVAQIRSALAFGSANVRDFGTPADKLWMVASNTFGFLFSPQLIALWVAVVVACIPAVPARVRSFALALVPLLAAVPALFILLGGDHLAFGTSAQSWLITLCAAIAVPGLLGAKRHGERGLLRLVVLAAPFSLVGYVTVAYVTNSSWNRGMPAVALAPLAVGLIACWAATVLAEGSLGALGTSAGLALLVMFALLFSTVFNDNSFWERQVRVKSGAYAGILTSPEHRNHLDEFGKRAPQWVGPDTRVTFLGQGEAYLVSGGVPYTPATWLYLGPGDAEALTYFRREAHDPGVVFVNDADVSNAGGYDEAPRTDPMLRWVLTRYHRAGEVGGFAVFVPR
jgi:hypothetical protein